MENLFKKDPASNKANLNKNNASLKNKNT